MADVVNKTTLQHLRSVNTPDFPTADWLINPDLSAVAAVPNKYWKIVAGSVVEMTQAEKDAVDAAAEVVRKTRIRQTIELRSDDGSVFDVGVDNSGNLTRVKQS